MKKALLMATMALSTVPTIESGIWSTLGQFMAKHQNKFTMAGFTVQTVKETFQDATITAQEIKISSLEGTIEALKAAGTTKTELINNQPVITSNSVSKLTFWTVTGLLGLSCYVAIRAAYANHLAHEAKQSTGQAPNDKKHQFSIDAILKVTTTPGSAILTLKKYGYNQEEFETICTREFEKNNQVFIQLLQKQDTKKSIEDIAISIYLGLA